MPYGQIPKQISQPSARAAFWDYSQNGTYFITICTANRECLFGNITNNTMLLSPIGEIVIREWDKSFEIRSELFCDVFVLMPNHLHAIVRIESPQSSPPPPQSTGVAYRPPKSISSFVAGFKSSATKNINEYCFRRDARPCCTDARPCVCTAVWQSRFHDHIVRDDAEYQRISDYIETNPQNWENDKFFKPDEL